MTPDIHNLIRELTQPTTHHEPYWITLVGQTRYHTTTHPPLITQLYDAVEPKSSVDAGIPRPASSKPAASLDAIDTAIRIDHDAGHWIEHIGFTRYGILRPQRKAHLETITRVSIVAGLATTHADIERDIRRWWTWARIITLWDQPAWQPNNTCPICATRGTLRVRTIEQLATCVNDNCRATWDKATIGLLADHIRAENHEDQAS